MTDEEREVLAARQAALREAQEQVRGNSREHCMAACPTSADMTVSPVPVALCSQNRTHFVL
jgi:hypothetical protein